MGAKFPKVARWFWLSGTLALIATTVFLGGNESAPVQAAAGINAQINFQARLQNSQGATVPDGNYNIQFKIYQDGAGCVSSGSSPCGGTLKWTEDWLNNNSQGVTVKNGYFSVLLGAGSDSSPLGTAVDFNQDTLWLSLNIGNTGSASTFAASGGDGEMIPFKRFAANPYALNSGKLGGLSSSQYVQLAQGLQADASTANASLAINKTGGTANILQLQRGGADVAIIANDGSTIFKNQADSAAGFRIQSATAAQTLFTANTTSNIIKIGDSTGTDAATTILQVDATTADPTTALSSRNGGLFYNSSSDQLKVIEAGAVARVCTTTSVCSGYAASAASGNYLQQVPATTAANTITPTVNGVVGLTVNGTSGTAATALSVVQSGNATALNVSGSGIGNLGTLDTTNASSNGVSIDVQSSSTSQYALNVTSNNGATQGLYVRADGKVGIGTTTLSAKLEVQISAATTEISRFAKVQAANDTGAYLMLAGGASGTTNRGLIGFTKTGTGGDTLFPSELADALGIRSEGAFQLSTGGGTTRLTVLSTGSVGVGTSSPVAGGGVTIAPAASTSGTPSLLVVTAPGHTTLANAEAIDVNLALNRTVQFGQNTTLALQRAAVIAAPTYSSSVATKTITDAATLAITGAPAEGANTDLGNSHALLVQGGAATGATNAYGLTVNAPTGATTGNYAAAFLGGNVGIGTASPDSILHVIGGACIESSDSGCAAGTGTLTVGSTATIKGANALTLGTANTNTAAIVLKGSGNGNQLTLQGPSSPALGAFTLSIPAITGNANVCTDNTICTGYAAAATTGYYLQQVPTSNTVNAVGANIISPTANSIVGLKINGTTGAAATALDIVQSGNAANLTLSNTAATSGNLVSLSQSTSAFTGTALLINLANGSGSFASGNFVDLQANGNSKFKISSTGTATLAAGQSYTGAGALTVSSGAATALTITGNAASTFSTSSGTLTVQGGSGTVSLGTSTNLTATGALTIGTGSGDLTLDPSGNTVIKGSTSVTGTAALNVQNSTASILYARNDGNIGIGNSSPSSRLEVGANGGADEIITVRSQSNAGLELYADTSNGGSNGAYIKLSGVGPSSGIDTLLGQINTYDQDPIGNSYTGTLPNATLLGTTGAGGSLQFGTDEQVRLTINSSGDVSIDGNLGIGTTNPSNPLDIGNGSFTVSSGGDVNLYHANIQGASALTLGLPSVYTGAITFKNASNTNNLVLQSGVTGGSGLTLTLPTADGNGLDCLKTNGSGVLTFAACLGGGGGGVSSLNVLQGDLTIAGTTNQINVSSGGTSITVSTPQDINTTSSPAFAGLRTGAAPASQTTITDNPLTSGATTINVVSTSGYPSGSATASAVILIDSEIMTYTGTSGGNQFTGVTRGVNGTTAASHASGASVKNYLLMAQSSSTTAPKFVVQGNGNVGIGTAAPTALFSVGTASALQVDSSGNVTNSGTYNSNTFSSSALTFGAAGTATVQAAASQALNITGHAASTISTDAGNLTLQAGSGTLSVGSSTVLQKSGTAFAIDLNSGSASTLTVNNSGAGAGSLSVKTGYQIGGAASTGHYLRGDGTNYVDSTIQVADLPSLSGIYVRNVPTTTANNQIVPTVASVVALTVRASTGGAANAFEILDSAAGTRQFYFDSTGAAVFSKAITAPTATNTINNLVINNGGIITNNGTIATGTGTINSNTFNSSALTFAASSTAVIQPAASQALTITGHAASTFSTDSGTLTVQGGNGTVSLGTSTTLSANAGLTLTTGGVGALLVQTADSTAANTAGITIRSGNATVGGPINSGAITIDTGSATGTAGAITIGGSNASALTLGRSTLGVSVPGALNLGVTSTTTGTIGFKNSANTGFVSLQGASTSTTNNVLTLPAETGTLCSTFTICTGYAAAAVSGNYVQQVPVTTSANTIAPTTASVVALTVKGTTGTAANVLEVFSSAASPTLQAYFNSAGSLNVSQLIQPTGNNTIDIGVSGGNAFRTGYFGTSVVSPLINTASGNLEVRTANTIRMTIDTSNVAYFGNGVTNASAGNFTLQGTGGSGLNKVGSTLTIAGGQGTGTNNGGDIIFQYSPAGVSSSTLNPLATACTISGTNGSLSCPGTGTGSERFGAGSTAGFNDSLSVGLNATVINVRGTAIGRGTSAGQDSVALGYNAANSGSSQIAIGSGSSTAAGATGAIAIGPSASANGIAIGLSASAGTATSIALGKNSATTGANQLVVGASTAGSTANAITNVYIGNGVTNTTPTGFTLQATGSGTAGTAGVTTTILGGAGATVTTGSAGGNLALQGGAAGGSAANNGGDVTIDGGAKTSTGTVGKVVLQGSNGGSVGIGTAAPLSKLDVNGSVAIGSYAGANAAPSNGLIVSGSVGVGTNNPGAKFDISNAAASNTTTGLQLQSTFAPTAGGTQTNFTSTVTNAPTSSANTVIGQSLTINDSTALTNTIQGINLMLSDTGSTAKTIRGLLVDTSGTTNASANVTAALFKGTTVTNLLIQNGSGSELLRADTANMVLKIGTTAAPTLSGGSAAKLFVTNSEIQSVLRVGDGTNGLDFAAGTAPSSANPLFKGTSRPTKKITLVPEFTGATMTGDGSNNSGTMQSDFCSSATAPYRNINPSVCSGSTDEHNYYSWTTSTSTNDYDIYIRYQLPSDWDGFASNTSINMWARRSTASDKVELALFNAAGNQCGSTTEINSSNTTWQEKDLTGSETTDSNCNTTNMAPGSTITFRIKTTATAANFAWAGELRFDYFSKF